MAGKFVDYYTRMNLAPRDAKSRRLIKRDTFIFAALGLLAGVMIFVRADIGLLFLLLAVAFQVRRIVRKETRWQMLKRESAANLHELKSHVQTVKQQ